MATNPDLIFQPPGFPGLLANMEEWNGLTRVATATIPFGTPVERVPANDMQCAPLSAGEYLGIAIAHHVVTATGVDSYGLNDNVPILDMGIIWVVASGAIAAGAPVLYDPATMQWGTVGIAVPGAEADSSAAAAGDLFKLRVRRVPG